MALGVGTRFGAYEIVGELGTGGMGEVYRREHAVIPRQVRGVAQKHTSTHPIVSSASMRAAAMFRRYSVPATEPRPSTRRSIASSSARRRLGFTFARTR